MRYVFCSESWRSISSRPDVSHAKSRHQWILCLAGMTGEPMKQEEQAVTGGQAMPHRSGLTYGRSHLCEPASQWSSFGRHRVAHLMRRYWIVSRDKRKLRTTTNSWHTHPVADNLVHRKFAVVEPNPWRVLDITDIPTREGWLYLANTLDRNNRKVIAWAMDRCITQQLTIDTFIMARKYDRQRRSLSHHSDQGVQDAVSRHGDSVIPENRRDSMPYEP